METRGRLKELLIDRKEISASYEAEHFVIAARPEGLMDKQMVFAVAKVMQRIRENNSAKKTAGKFLSWRIRAVSPLLEDLEKLYTSVPV
ncbi:MAG: hypothetical protein RMI43_00840 [Candidatus Caldarchaeum sp.]|nr:hypothetical protein [Candidatus Caldarchaeum sp.]